MGRGVIRGTSVCLTEVKGSLQSLGMVDGWVGFIRGTHSNFNKCVFLLTGTVKLVVRYNPRVLEEMEARFDKQRVSTRRRQSP